jgi:Spy/CpxP family protein refolding chaperone
MDAVGEWNSQQKETRMTRVLLVLTAALVMSTVSVRAEGGCCAAKRDSAASAGQTTMGPWASLEKLNLTADQKTKLETLTAECKKGGCSEAAHAKFMSGAKQILTADQFNALQTECSKAAKAGECPYKKKS